MAYRYRNVKTGDIIITTNRVSGKNWAPVEDPVQKPEEDSIEEETFEEETFEEETIEEEVPVAPVKTSRRGKK